MNALLCDHIVPGGHSDVNPTPADPEAWNAYLAEGNAKQARKRVAPHRPWDDRIAFIDGGYFARGDRKPP